MINYVDFNDRLSNKSERKMFTRVAYNIDGMEFERLMKLLKLVAPLNKCSCGELKKTIPGEKRKFFIYWNLSYTQAIALQLLFDSNI